MENVNKAKVVVTGITGGAAGIMAWLSARLGGRCYMCLLFLQL